MSTYNFTTTNAHEVQDALKNFCYFAEVEGKATAIGRISDGSKALLEKLKATAKKQKLTIDLSEEELDLFKNSHLYSHVC